MKQNFSDSQGIGHQSRCPLILRESIKQQKFRQNEIAFRSSVNHGLNPLFLHITRLAGLLFNVLFKAPMHRAENTLTSNTRTIKKEQLMGLNSFLS